MLELNIVDEYAFFVCAFGGAREITELKKKTIMSNLFIVVSVLLENHVLRCTLYIQCCTLQRYTFGTVLYSNSNSSLIKQALYNSMCSSCSRSVFFNKHGLL